MVYTLLFSATAIKQLKKLPKDIQQRISSSLERIRIRPESHVKRLVGQHYYSFRAGDYRAIIDIKKNIMVILVINVGHRKKIYK